MKRRFVTTQTQPTNSRTVWKFSTLMCRHFTLTCWNRTLRDVVFRCKNVAIFIHPLRMCWVANAVSIRIGQPTPCLNTRGMGVSQNEIGWCSRHILVCTY